MPDTATPGADLAPLDRLIHTAHETGPPPSEQPVRTGRAFGFVFAVFQRHDDPARVGQYAVYVADAETGEHVPGYEPKSWDRTRYRQVPHHSCESPAEAERICFVQQLKRMRDHHHPLKAIRMMVRDELEEKTRRLHYDQRHACDQERKRKRAVQALHGKDEAHVSPSDVRSLRPERA